MSNRTSAARYARALFEVAQQESDIQKVQQDLDAVVATIAEHPELGRVFESRTLDDGARRNIIVAVGERLGVAVPVRKLLGLLADRRRLELLPDLAAVYTEHLLAFQNVLQAEVATAAPLGADQAAALQQSLAAATGKEIIMQLTVDPALLGGVVTRVGSTVYDGSVRTQLKKMRDQLVAQG